MIIHTLRRENPYVQIDKRLLEDESLSWKAKGIAAYLLSKPPAWTVRRADIESHGADGRESVQAGLADLAAAGYARLVPERGEDGKVTGKKWVIAESRELLIEGLGEIQTTSKGVKTTDERESRSSVLTSNSTDERENRLTGKPSDGKAVRIVTINPNKNDLSNSEGTSQDASLDDGTLPMFPQLEKENPASVEAMKIVEHVATVNKAAELNAWATRIYDAYPRKSSKFAAHREIIKAIKKGAAPEFLLAKVERYFICRMGKDPTFTRKAENWFRDGDFLDDEGQWAANGQTPAHNVPMSGQSKPVGKVGMSIEERRRARAA